MLMTDKSLTAEIGNYSAGLDIPPVLEINFLAGSKYLLPSVKLSW